MDETATLTLTLAGYHYIGTLPQWRGYTNVLTAGRIAAYRQSPAYGNQSLQNFFEFFTRTWAGKTPIPKPESYGLIPLQPANITQNQLIEELLKKAA
jgi:hypothetical protein